MQTERYAGVAVPDAVGGAADEHARRLHDAAFGAGPGPGVLILPPARTLQERWWRAVAHGAAGFYARAGADLAALRRSAEAVADPAWSSLAASTAASLLRQMGGHGRAAVYDGRALSHLAAVMPAPDGEADADGAPRAQAWADAITGLAADNLGRGDWRSSRRLLALVSPPGGPARARGGPDCGGRAALRRRWVAAEAAMTAGEADAALREAAAARDMIEAAREMTEATTGQTPFSERHRIKTILIGAAANAVAGRRAAAARSSALACAAAGEAGLVPLRWAAAMLSAGLGEGADAAVAAEDARHCAAVLRARGGGEPGTMRGYG